MSGLAYPENPIKTGVYRRLRPRLFAFVHGVSVVILWLATGPHAHAGAVTNSEIRRRNLSAPYPVSLGVKHCRSYLAECIPTFAHLTRETNKIVFCDQIDGLIDHLCRRFRAEARQRQNFPARL